MNNISFRIIDLPASLVWVAGWVVLVLAPSNSVAQSSVPESTTDGARRTIVSCKLPPQTRKMSQSQTFTVPGRVVRLEVRKCEQRGGSYSSSRPGK